MPDDVAAQARSAWLAAGLPEPMCAAPMVLEVSAEELADVCDSNEINPQACLVGDATVYATADAFEDPNHGDLVHATFHAWSACTLGDPDTQHTNARVWRVAAQDPWR
jgi:hypothetical protein